MKRLSALLSCAAVLALAVGLVVSAAGVTQGTVVYRVQGSATLPSMGPGSTNSTTSSTSFTFSETLSPGSNASVNTILLSVATGDQNFSYSRSINASLQVEPFLPAIANQTFSYSSNGSSITAGISRNGSVPLTFQGAGYSLSSYAYNAQLTFSLPSLSGLNMSGLGAAGLGLTGQSSITSLGAPTTLSSLPPMNDTTTITGSIKVFPSGLIYSMTGSVTGLLSFSITLLSTNLPLNAPGPSTATQVASIGIGAGAVGTALALGLGVRHRRQTQKTADQKPEHWVD